MKNPYDVLIQPMITEKSTILHEDSNTIAFKVHPDANKIEIRNAVETLFDVTVIAVHTIAMKGKRKRLGVHEGRRSAWKKAYVTLAEGDKISFFEA
jgi:large subunit ribosomal protein L23